MLSSLLKILLRLFYRDFDLDNSDYPKTTLLKYGINQRILGYNRKVPWPVHKTSVVKCPEKIQRGSKAPGYSMGCYLDGRNGIIIEENVWTGPRVSIISMNHNSYDYTKYEDSPPVIIRKNSLLATNCVIMPGVELGEHTIVAPGAVVTRSFPDGDQILAGNPAMKTKKLEPYTGKT